MEHPDIQKLLQSTKAMQEFMDRLKSEELLVRQAGLDEVAGTLSTAYQLLAVAYLNEVNDLDGAEDSGEQDWPVDD